MKGPDFITADGRRLPLTWHRLKPSSEVSAKVPQPGEAVLTGLDFAGEWKRVRDVDAGEGFDRRRFRVRSWQRTTSRPAVFVRSEDGSTTEIKPSPAWAPWVGGRDEAGEPPVRYISLPLDRPWQASEMKEIEAEAAAILQAHGFPMGLDYPDPPVWRQLGDDMAWTILPAGEAGGIEGEAAVVRLTDPGWVLIDYGPLSSRWPAGSPFRWAQTVYRLARPYRLLSAELMALAGPARAAGAIETIFSAAFELGSALAEDAFRRLYDDDLRAGQQANRVRRQGGQTTAKRRRTTADEAWRTEGLKVAKALRSKFPSYGQKRIAKEIVEGIAGAPAIDTVVAQIRAWEKSGELLLSARRQAATPPS